jgi:hypothetical protein
MANNDAFADIGIMLSLREWKTPIFSGKEVPKTPNASYVPGAK